MATVFRSGVALVLISRMCTVSNRPMRLLVMGLLLLLSTPALGSDFSLVLMPDTQYYTDPCDKCRWTDEFGTEHVITQIYERQAQWIVDNESYYNISRVIHLGDITNGATDAMWSVAREAHGKLGAAGIPFSVIPGNHDYDGNTVVGRNLTAYTSKFSDYYPGWCDGSLDSTNANTYVLFDEQGLQFLLVNLEYRPRKTAICWANDVISSYPDRRVIVATHGYQGHDGVHSPLSGNIVGADGRVLWDELIRRHSNIFLVLSGHINDSEHVARTGLAGNVIHEVLTDYQYESPHGEDDPCISDGTGRCGNGWLKLLRFLPSENRIDVVTLTSEQNNTAIFPHALVAYPEFFTGDYRRDPATDDHVLSLAYDMTSGPPPYVFSAGDATFGDAIVNVVDNGDQRDPQIAMDAGGNMVVVWEDDRDGNGSYDIWMRGLAPGGCELFSERRANVVTSGQQRKPAVAMDNASNFVVVWEDDLDGNGYYDIRARGFDALGGERFSERDVNAVTGGQQLDPFIAMDADGDFVVVWEDDYDGNGYYDIRARGFDSNCNQRFAQMTPHSDTSGQQNDAVVALDEDGDFVVAWRHDPDKNDSYDIWVHGFNANGTARFSDRRVNSNSAGQQNDPYIAMEPNGDFLVTWEDDNDGNGSYDIWLRRYGANGSSIGEGRVNVVTSGEQRNPGVGVNSSGDWIVVWQDDSDGNGYYDINARGGHKDGSDWVPQMIVNSNGAGQQQLPEVVVDDSGCFVTVWKDDVDGNGTWEVAARGIGLFDVTTESGPGGTASGGGSQQPSGSFVTVTATPAAGYAFVGWTGDVENPRAATDSVCVGPGKHVKANFEPIENSLLDGLVAYWSFDEDFTATLGGSVFDGHAGGSSGAPVTGPGGKFGGAAQFVRTDSHYVAVDSPVITPGVDHSYSAWYRATWTTIGNVNERYFVLETTGSDTAYAASYGLRDIQGDGLTQGQVYTRLPFESANMDFDHSSGEDQWHNVIVTYDASMARHSAFLDGQPVGTLESWSVLEETDGVVIGGHRGQYGRNWDGWIDDVAFWNRTLTTEEIALVQTSAITGVATATAPVVAGIVLEHSLSAARPNPFVSSTTFRFALPKKEPVRVVVYNVLGRRVTTLVDGVLPVGHHSAVWAGQDDGGRHVANGVYFVRIEAGTFRATRKVSLLR